MGKEILTFIYIEIGKKRKLDIEKSKYVKVFVSNKISFGDKSHKYFIKYLHNDHKVKSLHIMLPKTRAYVKVYDGKTKWIYFLIWKWLLITKI